MQFLLPIIESRNKALQVDMPDIGAPLKLVSRFSSTRNFFELAADLRPKNLQQFEESTLELGFLIEATVLLCVEEAAYSFSGPLSHHVFQFPDGDDDPPEQSFRVLGKNKLRQLEQQPLTSKERTEFLAILDRYGFLTELAYADYLKRKIAQAQTIAYFDDELARDFLNRAIPAQDGPRYSVQAFLRWIEPIRKGSDEMFQALMTKR